MQERQKMVEQVLHQGLSISAAAAPPPKRQAYRVRAIPCGFGARANVVWRS